MRILDNFQQLPENPDFRYLLSSSECEAERAYLEQLWEVFEPFADRQFLVELGKDFHQRFWEMYLGCTLINLGFELMPKRQDKGPDLCVLLNNSRIWIEAIAPTGGEKADVIREPEFNTERLTWFRIPEEKLILRFTSAICEKWKKLQTYREIVQTDEPYIIAINGGAVPYSRYGQFDDELPRIVKSVFPLGHSAAIIDCETNTVVENGYEPRSEVTKENKVSISTSGFLENRYPGVSGILFSNVSVSNRLKWYGQDFVFVHNRFESKNLPLGWLQVGKEYWLENSILHGVRHS